jgi:hypothetical protein
MKMTLAAVGLLSLVVALPAFGETYRYTYPVACSDLWPAVKDVLSDPANYQVKSSDDKKFTASYKVNHSIHVTITETVLQRTNKVTLVTQGTGCEMQVVSNYSGVEHDDRGDFKKRVDDSLAKLQTPKRSDSSTPAAPPADSAPPAAAPAGPGTPAAPPTDSAPPAAPPK